MITSFLSLELYSLGGDLATAVREGEDDELVEGGVLACVIVCTYHYLSTTLAPAYLPIIVVCANSRLGRWWCCVGRRTAVVGV